MDHALEQERGSVAIGCFLYFGPYAALRYKAAKRAARETSDYLMIADLGDLIYPTHQPNAKRYSS